VKCLDTDFLVALLRGKSDAKTNSIGFKSSQRKFVGNAFFSKEKFKVITIIIKIEKPERRGDKRG